MTCAQYLVVAQILIFILSYFLLRESQPWCSGGIRVPFECAFSNERRQYYPCKWRV
ncbi:Uncharacterized protein APZ42_032718 [Daphnia magna]|uniref:Uncharacterized protein n=1 Tax=Daphnia magna TaxID=35525 RepID=A0A164LSZ1_9CRUS|nr:Uncharacterized protein APZ42_032718 [Daphnia magna]